jgi:hypothetical protein
MQFIINAWKEGPNRLVEVSYILEVPGSKLSPRGKFQDSMSNYTTPVSFNVSSTSLVIAIQ